MVGLPLFNKVINMSLEEPGSMDDVLYFTNRTIGNGKARAWVYKVPCPECGKAKMGKPIEKGKVLVRAKEYRCPVCGHTEEKKMHEEKLDLEIMYTCPQCGKTGEATTLYKKKSYQGVPSYLFECGSCKMKIAITKKMKDI